MQKKIQIKNNISFRSYNFEEKNSRSYIIDEKLRYYYLLEGSPSDIWNIIVQSQDYDTVYEYAKRQKVENEINEFLKELKDLNLITIQNSEALNITRNETKKDIISADFDRMKQTEFEDEMSNWLFKNNFLQGLVLQLGYNCNLKCNHCFNDKKHNNYELNFELAKKAIDQAYEIGIIKVGLTGGECTINKDFLKIIRYIREKHLSFGINTNGVRLYEDENLFEEFISLNPYELKISLYSMNPDIHDSMTGIKGSHEKTIGAIKKLRENNITATINTLLVKQNWQGYKDIIQFSKEMGCRINMSAHFISNPENKNAILRLSPKELESLYSNKDFPRSVYTQEEEGTKKEEDNRAVCLASQVVLSVSPMYNVTPCNDFDYVLGNLHKDNLTYIWNNVVPEFRKKFLNKNLECRNNNYCKYCTYCPGSVMRENGFLKKSKIACENAQAYYNCFQCKV